MKLIVYCKLDVFRKSLFVELELTLFITIDKVSFLMSRKLKYCYQPKIYKNKGMKIV